jgi:hypothetical protein
MLNLNADFIVLMFWGVTFVCGVVPVFLIQKREKIERQQAIASGNLIVIKAQRGKALLRLALLMAGTLPFIAMTLLEPDKSKHACVKIFDINILSIMMIYGVPFSFIFIIKVYVDINIAKKALVTGFFPPVDTISLHDVDAFTGEFAARKAKHQLFQARRMKPLAFMLPLLLGYMFIKVNYFEIFQQLEHQCLSVKHYP